MVKAPQGKSYPMCAGQSSVSQARCVEACVHSALYYTDGSTPPASPCLPYLQINKPFYKRLLKCYNETSVKML